MSQLSRVQGAHEGSPRSSVTTAPVGTQALQSKVGKDEGAQRQLKEHAARAGDAGQRRSEPRPPKATATSEQRAVPLRANCPPTGFHLQGGRDAQAHAALLGPHGVCRAARPGGGGGGGNRPTDSGNGAS